MSEHITSILETPEIGTDWVPEISNNAKSAITKPGETTQDTGTPYTSRPPSPVAKPSSRPQKPAVLPSVKPRQPLALHMWGGRQAVEFVTLDDSTRAQQPALNLAMALSNLDPTFLAPFAMVPSPSRVLAKGKIQTKSSLSAAASGIERETLEAFQEALAVILGPEQQTSPIKQALWWSLPAPFAFTLQGFTQYFSQVAPDQFYTVLRSCFIDQILKIGEVFRPEHLEALLSQEYVISALSVPPVGNATDPETGASKTSDLDTVVLVGVTKSQIKSLLALEKQLSVSLAVVEPTCLSLVRGLIATGAADREVQQQARWATLLVQDQGLSLIELCGNTIQQMTSLPLFMPPDLQQKTNMAFDAEERREVEQALIMTLSTLSHVAGWQNGEADCFHKLVLVNNHTFMHSETLLMHPVFCDDMMDRLTMTAEIMVIEQNATTLKSFGANGPYEASLEAIGMVSQKIFQEAPQLNFLLEKNQVYEPPQKLAPKPIKAEKLPANVTTTATTAAANAYVEPVLHPPHVLLEKPKTPKAPKPTWRTASSNTVTPVRTPLAEPEMQQEQPTSGTEFTVNELLTPRYIDVDSEKAEEAEAAEPIAEPITEPIAEYNIVPYTVVAEETETAEYAQSDTLYQPPSLWVRLVYAAKQLAKTVAILPNKMPWMTPKNRQHQVSMEELDAAQTTGTGINKSNPFSGEEATESDEKTLQQTIHTTLFWLNAGFLSLALAITLILQCAIWFKQGTIQHLKTTVPLFKYQSLESGGIFELNDFVQAQVRENILLNNLLVRVAAKLPEDTWLNEIQIERNGILRNQIAPNSARISPKAIPFTISISGGTYRADSIDRLHQSILKLNPAFKPLKLHGVSLEQDRPLAGHGSLDHPGLNRPYFKWTLATPKRNAAYETTEAQQQKPPQKSSMP